MPNETPPPAEPTRLEKAHDGVLKAVAERLKTYKSTSRLVGDRVYLKDAVPPTPELPYLVLSKGRNHGNPGSVAATFAQLDFRVEGRDDHEAGVPLLAQAVQHALNGWTSKPALDHCVLADTGTVESEDGYHARRDSFGAFYHDRPPADDA